MAFWPEMTFWPEIFFLPDMAIWQEITFRPEMAMNQNWSNQLHFGQNGFSDRIFFYQKCLFGRNCCSAENDFWPKTILSNLKWLLGQKWQWTRMAFKSEIAFLLEIAFQPIILLSNLIVAFWLQMPYFSKYWKVWLAFDGWKLSGLFFKVLPVLPCKRKPS